jgi:hypothetical protein
LRRLAAAPQPYDVATATRSTSELGKLRMWVWLELQSTPTLMDDDIDRVLTVDYGTIAEITTLDLELLIDAFGVPRTLQ